MSESDLVRWLRESETIGEFLKCLRLSQELTLHEVANYTGLTKGYISLLERGQKEPERDTLVSLLLAAFSLSVSLANRVLIFAGYAPLHHKAIARKSA